MNDDSALHDRLRALSLGSAQPSEAASEGAERFRRAEGASLPLVSEELDADQRRVVIATHPTLRVLAPAGSGKTHVMVNRIVRLRRDGVPAARILVLTYDNSSVGELKARLAVLQGVDVHPSTLNAFGYNLFKRLEWEDGRRPSVASDPDKRRLCGQSLQKLRSDPAIGRFLPTELRVVAYLGIISLFKNQVYSAKEPWPSHDAGVRRMIDVLEPVLPALNKALLDFMADAAGLEGLLIALRLLYVDYELRMRASFQIDYDDQKLLPYLAMNNDTALCASIQGMYEEVIVDECQDLNRLDFELIDLICRRCRLTMVGDDDQAIYEFRGASPTYLLGALERTRRDVHTVILTRNYRSPANLVRHASRLIANNRERHPKEAVGVIADRDCAIRVQQFHDLFREADAIAKWIKREARRSVGASEVARYSEFAILYRMNAQALLHQVALILNDVPYVSMREDEATGVRYVRDVLAIVRCHVGLRARTAVGQADAVTLLAKFMKYCGEEERQRLTQALPHGEQLMLATLDSALANAGAAASERGRFAEQFELLKRAEKVPDVLSVIRQDWHGLSRSFASFQEVVEEWAPLDDLVLIGEEVSDPSRFVEVVGKAVSRATTGRPIAKQSRDGVILSTYFKAKGRQFRSVVLPSLVEGWVPHVASSRETERRLFYVAVTRATHDLLLTFPEHVMNRRKTPSPFLAELGLTSPKYVT